MPQPGKIRKRLSNVGLVVLSSALILGVLPVWVPGAIAEESEPSAVLAVVAGDVIIKRGDENLNGSFGAALQAGDVVETGAEAQAAVGRPHPEALHLADGVRAPCRAEGPEPDHARGLFPGLLPVRANHTPPPGGA